MTVLRSEGRDWCLEVRGVLEPAEVLGEEASGNSREGAVWKRKAIEPMCKMKKINSPEFQGPREKRLDFCEAVFPYVSTTDI